MLKIRNKYNKIHARRVGFLYRTMSCNNTVMNFLYDVFGRYELQALLAKYDITGICSPRRFRFLARNLCVLCVSFLCSLTYVVFFLFSFSFFFSFYCVCFVICCRHSEIKFIYMSFYCEVSKYVSEKTRLSHNEQKKEPLQQPRSVPSPFRLVSDVLANQPYTTEFKRYSKLQNVLSSSGRVTTTQGFVFRLITSCLTLYIIMRLCVDLVCTS